MSPTPTVAGATVRSLAPSTMVQPQLRNLVHNMRLIHIIPWMQEVDFVDVERLWVYAQSLKPKPQQLPLLKDGK